MQTKLWVSTALLLLFAAACGSGTAPTPAPGSVPVHVLEIWDDYQLNEPRANETWKKRWLYLEMPVDVVENEGPKYYITGYTGAFGEYAIMGFANEDRLLELVPGQQLLATCRLTGLILGYILRFRDCQ